MLFSLSLVEAARLGPQRSFLPPWPTDQNSVAFLSPPQSHWAVKASRLPMSFEDVDTSWLIPRANRFLGYLESGENPWGTVALSDVSQRQVSDRSVNSSCDFHPQGSLSSLCLQGVPTPDVGVVWSLHRVTLAAVTRQAAASSSRRQSSRDRGHPRTEYTSSLQEIYKR